MGSTIGKDEEILKLYASGDTMQQIGDKFGVSRQMVCQVLQKHNVKGDKSRRGRKPIAAEVIDGYVAEAVRTGSKQVAAEKFGVSVDAITRALRKRGVSMRKDKYTTESVKEDITSRYLKGERHRGGTAAAQPRGHSRSIRVRSLGDIQAHAHLRVGIVLSGA